MPLRSKHFTQPARNNRLEQCLVSDPAHVTRGSSGDHVVLIQEALNKLRRLPNGEGFRLAVTGTYDAPTADAVLTYKERRDIVARPRQGKADNVVGKMTIAALDDDMLSVEQLDEKVKIKISPTFGGPLTGGCDMNGFSNNRMTRHGDSGDWTTSRARIPVHQMIPMGLTRTLRFDFHAAGGFAALTDDSTIAQVVDVRRAPAEGDGQRHFVTILGKRPGITDLHVSVGGRRQDSVRLPVRARQLVHLNAVYLGQRGPAGKVPGMLSEANNVEGFAHGVFSWLNMIVTPQTNILFVPISIRVEPRVRYRGGQPFEIDPKKPLFMLSNSETAPPGSQATTRIDLAEFHQTTGITLFYGPNLRHVDETTMAVSWRGRRMCWAPMRSSHSSPYRALIYYAAHEVLHALGASHIQTGENLHFLMTPAPVARSVHIPSETLVDI